MTKDTGLLEQFRHFIDTDLSDVENRPPEVTGRGGPPEVRDLMLRLPIERHDLNHIEPESPIQLRSVAIQITLHEVLALRNQNTRDRTLEEMLSNAKTCLVRPWSAGRYCLLLLEKSTSSTAARCGQSA